MFKRMKSMWKAGRTGQPMPAKVDRSVGEVALETGALVGVFMVTLWGIAALSKVGDNLLTNKKDREIKDLKRDLEIRKLRNQNDDEASRDEKKDKDGAEAKAAEEAAKKAEENDNPAKPQD